jgi:hypothetical protein
METRRRELLTAALAGAGVMAHGRNSGVAAEDEGNAALLSEIREELRTIRAACCQTPGEVTRIRAVQNAYLRSTGKFPEIIEIGTHHWEVVHDWLRLAPQPLDVAQLANGRYGMRLGFTTLVLRPDAPADFVGTAQDR